MTEYLKDSFSVYPAQNKAFRDNYDAIFGGPKFLVVAVDKEGVSWYLERAEAGQDGESDDFTWGSFRIDGSRLRREDADKFLKTASEEESEMTVSIEPV